MGVSGKGGNAKEIIIAMMKQMSQNERFIKRDDILTMLGSQFNRAELESGIDRLLDDGAIYSTYDKDVYALEE